jgi:tetratricopeptide (TPR) repeat protein
MMAATAADPAAQVFTAIRTFESSEARNPGDANIETELALNFFLADQRQLFREAITKALKLDPNLGQAYYLTGRFALETQQDPEAACQAFRKVLQLAPDAEKARYFLAIALRDLGQSEAARDELQRVTRLTTYSWPFRALAEVELDLNSRQLALQAARKAIDLEPQSMDNFLIAGKAHSLSRKNMHLGQLRLRRQPRDPRI